MGFVENLIDNFSAKELESRVKGVVVAGFIICAAALAGLYLLLASEQRVVVEGTARWTSGQEISVSVDAEDLTKLASVAALEAEFLSPPDGRLSFRCDLTAIEPNPPTVHLSCEEMPKRLHELEKMEATLILLKRPLWRMLWNPKI